MQKKLDNVKKLKNGNRFLLYTFHRKFTRLAIIVRKLTSKTCNEKVKRGVKKPKHVKLLRTYRSVNFSNLQFMIIFDKEDQI